MRRQRFGGLVALAVVAAALASCGKKPETVSSSAAVAPPPGPVTLTIQDHKFTPSQITVPANQAVEIEVVNKDPQAEEFDSTALKVEKVVAGGQSGTIHLRPLDPGSYPFTGEYHAETAKGVVIAK